MLPFYSTNIYQILYRSVRFDVQFSYRSEMYLELIKSGDDFQAICVDCTSFEKPAMEGSRPVIENMRR